MSKDHPSLSTPSGEGSPFIYLLNALEHASQFRVPAEHGYAEKRQAVLDYVAKLETSARSETGRISVSRSLAERTEAMFRSVDPEGHIAQEWKEALRG